MFLYVCFAFYSLDSIRLSCPLAYLHLKRQQFLRAATSTFSNVAAAAADAIIDINRGDQFPQAAVDYVIINTSDFQLNDRESLD